MLEFESSKKVEMHEQNQNIEIQGELDNIFEEKLYVSKKKPLADRTNSIGGIKDNLMRVERNFIDKENINSFKEGKSVELEGNSVEIKEQRIPKESTLQEIYDDVELSDVLKTRESFESKNKRVTFVELEDFKEERLEIKEENLGEQDNKNTYNLFKDTVKDKGELNNRNTYDSSKNTVVILDELNNKTLSNSTDVISNRFDNKTLSNSTDVISNRFDNKTLYKNTDIIANELDNKNKEIPNNKKIKELEIEFDLMLQTQKDALKLKSKLYQFVHTEILEMRRSFHRKNEELNKENESLRKEIQELNGKVIELDGKLFKMKEKTLQKNKEISNKIQEWKVSIEKQVYEHLKKIRK